MFLTRINKHFFKYSKIHITSTDIFSLDEEQLFSEQPDFSDFCLKLIQLLSAVSDKLQRSSNVDNVTLLENVVEVFKILFF